jgi:hypothetical protein
VIALGIDPGLDGAIAFMHGDRMSVHDLPTVPVLGSGTVTRRLHGPGLASLIRQQCPVGEPILALIEDLSAGGRDSSAQTVGSQYRTRGAIECCLEMLRLEPAAVHARTWKKFFGLDSDKARALRLARELFPGMAEGLRLAKHHNRAEALLIARYGLKVLA